LVVIGGLKINPSTPLGNMYFWVHRCLLKDKHGSWYSGKKNDRASNNLDPDDSASHPDMWQLGHVAKGHTINDWTL